MYVQITNRHIEHINSMAYFESYGLFINGDRIGVPPEKAKATFDFILDSLREGATLVDITKPLERNHHDSENR